MFFKYLHLLVFLVPNITQFKIPLIAFFFLVSQIFQKPLSDVSIMLRGFLRRITLEHLLQLKEDLEQSISQLRSQRLQRNSGGRSVSVTSLSASDLDGGAVAGRLLVCSKSFFPFWILKIFLKYKLNALIFREIQHIHKIIDLID